MSYSRRRLLSLPEGLDAERPLHGALNARDPGEAWRQPARRNA